MMNLLLVVLISVAVGAFLMWMADRRSMDRMKQRLDAARDETNAYADANLTF